MKYNFPPEIIENLGRILAVKEFKHNHVSYKDYEQAELEFQTNLADILATEFPNSELGILYSEFKPVRVIVFENVDDRLAFVIKYGDIYGDS